MCNWIEVLQCYVTHIIMNGFNESVNKHSNVTKNLKCYRRTLQEETRQVQIIRIAFYRSVNNRAIRYSDFDVTGYSSQD